MTRMGVISGPTCADGGHMNRRIWALISANVKCADLGRVTTQRQCFDHVGMPAKR